MALKYNNSAGRVYHYLSRASDDLVTGDHHQSTLAVWGRVFELQKPELTPYEVYRRLVALGDQLDDAVREYQAVPGISHDLLIAQIPRVKAILGPVTLSDSWTQTHHAISKDILLMLEVIADQINHHNTGVVISDDQLQELEAAITDLYNEIRDSQIDIQLKRALLDLAQNMRQSIHEYEMRGAEGMHRAIYEAVRKMGSSVVAENKGNPLVQKIWDWMKKVNVIVTSGRNGVDLLMGVMKALE